MLTMSKSRLFAAGALWAFTGAAFAQDQAVDAAATATVPDAPPAADAPAPEALSDQSASGGGSGSWFSDIDFSFGGFIRPEVSFKSSSQENANNQRGNPYNGVAQTRQAGDPTTGFGPILAGSALTNSAAVGGTVAGLFSALPVVNGQIPVTDQVARPVSNANNVFNLHILRAEAEVGMTITHDLKMIGRIRAIGDFGQYSDFNGGSLNSLQGGISGGDPALYGGAPNYFQYRVEHNKHPNPLEIAGPNYMAYFSTLILDYNHGPLNVRVGNQAIAWGQAIFFRVLDVVDGLDLRRHSVLDYAQEEFADKRVPAPAIRIGYQFSDEILADAYFQKFQPTIYGNPNTQYNVIPVQFTVHDRYDDYANKYSYGLRLKANFGQWGFQAIAVRRWNPDGVFRWTASGVDKNLPNTNIFGIAENTLHNGTTGPSTGAILAQTPFEASPGGVYSANEWFHYAAMVRLNGITGLNAAVNDFAPATTQLLASPVNDFQSAHNELDTFFIASGGSLRGHIERKFFQEYNFGGGVSYVVDGEPGTILDQLIINLETTYTPNRTYTSPDLGKGFLRSNDWVSALVMEKYHRFTQAFPATYFVFQAMHRTKDDLFGRSLKGYGGGDNNVSTGVGGGANYLVFAFQQPFPQDIYRIGFAVLGDPRGSVLVQPGIRWQITGKWQLSAFYTYINDRLGSNPNSTLLGNLQWANEGTLRLSYQF